LTTTSVLGWSPVGDSLLENIRLEVVGTDKHFIIRFYNMHYRHKSFLVLANVNFSSKINLGS
jgi:hypothetical protein